MMMISINTCSGDLECSKAWPVSAVNFHTDTESSSCNTSGSQQLQLAASKIRHDCSVPFIVHPSSHCTYQIC